MKKWNILILITIIGILSLPIIYADYFTAVEGGANEQSGGFIAAVKGWFNQPFQSCVENWVAGTSACLINDTRLISYTDSNGCGTFTDLPADNATFHSTCNYCSLELVTGDITKCLLNDGNETHNVTVFDKNYATCCNVTGLGSDCYEDDSQSLNKTYYETQVCEEELEVESIAIAIFLIGVMFWLIYTANTLKTVNEESQKAIPLNTLIKLLMYASAGFTAFVAIQLALGFAMANNLNQNLIQSALSSQYSLMLYIGIIIFGLILFGMLGNAAINAINKIRGDVDPRKRRGNGRL